MENSQPAVKTTKQRSRKVSVPIEIDRGPAQSAKPFLKQGTTWAGIFSIAAAVATGGASVLTDPYMVAQIGAGLGLLFAEN